jgi:hypothetical protein
MDKKYLLEVRRQAVELCIFDGIMLTPENIINALSELGYIVAAQHSVQLGGAELPAEVDPIIKAVIGMLDACVQPPRPGAKQ